MRFLNLFSWGRLSRKINRWLARRQWNIFIYALPAILAGTLFVVAVAMVLFNHRQFDVLQQRYHRLALTSLFGKNFELARVACLRGLDHAGTQRDRLEWTYYLAISLNGLGRKADAEALVRLAAPVDHPGCVPAHVGLAQGMLYSTNLTTNLLALAERHLKLALALEPQSEQVNELLGRFYINTHNLPKARQHLLKIYSQKPEVAGLLAITYYLEKDAPNGILWADRAIQAYEQKLMESAPVYAESDRIELLRSFSVKEHFAPTRRLSAAMNQSIAASTNLLPQDSPAFWFGMVRLLLLDGKFGAALQTLESQSALTTNAVYASAIAEICARWAIKIAANDKDSLDLRLKLIQKGLKNAPDNLTLRLLLIQARFAPGNNGLAAQQLFDEALKGQVGDSGGWWHFLLYCDYRDRGDLPAARHHLQMACDLAPQVSQFQNDLALNLSAGNRQDQERGLTIIESVLQKDPLNPHFRDTRGRIFALLGRNESAAADLEFAFARLGDSVNNRAVLAKVNAALGRIQPVAAPGDSPAAVLKLVRSLVGQANYAQAVEKLESAIIINPNPVLASTLADVCAAWLESASLRNVSAASERLQIIQKGLNQSPEHHKLRLYLLKASQASDDSRLLAKNLLDQYVSAAAGQSAAGWHQLLGQDAWARGDFSVARQEFEAAYRLAPQLTLNQSNLAQALLTDRPEDLERGLQIIQAAVNALPQNPEYRNIRGKILARLGRNQAAVDDLKFASEKLSNPVETRKILAEVYEALGKPQLARQVRSLGKPGGK